MNNKNHLFDAIAASIFSVLLGYSVAFGVWFIVPLELILIVYALYNSTKRQ